MDTIKSAEPNNWFLYFCAFSAALLGLSTGNAYGWTSPAIPVLYDTDSPLSHPITIQQESWIIGLLSLGAACGPIFAGAFIDKFGRKKMLILSSALISISYLVIAFTSSIEYYLAARFFLGVGCGFMFTALPMYVGEIAETTNRGVLGCMMGVMIAVGIAICYIAGTFTSLRVFTIICTIPSILFLFTFGLFAPESPFYYINCGNKPAALESLTKLRTNKSSVEKELEEIEKYVMECKANKGGFRDLMKSRRGMKSLVICSGAMIFQQLSGITAVLGSMQSILDSSDTGIPGNISTIAIAVLHLLVNILASQLADRLGRKILFLVSSTGSTISLLCLATFFYLRDSNYNTDSLFWLPVVSLSSFIAAYALALGPLPWAITAEFFPSNIKALCTTVTAFSCLILAFLITFIYPDMINVFGMAQTFYFFGACSGVGILFFAYVVPETTGKTFEEIQIMLGRD